MITQFQQKIKPKPKLPSLSTGDVPLPWGRTPAEIATKWVHFLGGVRPQKAEGYVPSSEKLEAEQQKARARRASIERVALRLSLLAFHFR